jgi:hypothetical protein
MLKSPQELSRLFVNRGPSPDHDEERRSLLMPESLLPVQYYSTNKTGPCYRLLLAVLEDAIRCFQRNCDATTVRRQILFREAKEWLFGFDATAFMSFSTVCESLGVDPLMLRRRLREWRIRTRHERDGQRRISRKLVFR